jgi:hypothetical protein
MQTQPPPNNTKFRVIESWNLNSTGAGICSREENSRYTRMCIYVDNSYLWSTAKQIVRSGCAEQQQINLLWFHISHLKGFLRGLHRQSSHRLILYRSHNAHILSAWESNSWKVQHFHANRKLNLNNKVSQQPRKSSSTRHGARVKKKF